MNMKKSRWNSKYFEPNVYIVPTSIVLFNSCCPTLTKFQCLRLLRELGNKFKWNSLICHSFNNMVKEVYKCKICKTMDYLFQKRSLNFLVLKKSLLSRNHGIFKFCLAKRVWLISRSKLRVINDLANKKIFQSWIKASTFNKNLKIVVHWWNGSKVWVS